jgi:integrase
VQGVPQKVPCRVPCRGFWWLISQAPQAPEARRSDCATPAADLMALAFFCGLRPGEIGGLRWEDFDAEWVHVRRSVWRGIAKLPKTQTGIRSVPLIDRVGLFLSCGMRSVANPRKAEFLKAIAGNG